MEAVAAATRNAARAMGEAAASEKVLGTARIAGAESARAEAALVRANAQATNAQTRQQVAASKERIAATRAEGLALRGEIAEERAGERARAEITRQQAAGYRAATAEAKRSAAERTRLAREASRAEAAAVRAATSASARQAEAQKKAGVGLVAVGVGIAAGFAVAAKAAMEFDKQMSLVGTLAKLKPASAQLDQLRHAALTMGQDIGYSANQVADAEAELVKGGLSVAQILGGGLRASLTLAAAGQISVADATNITVVAMTQFGLKGKDAGRIADELAAGADKALGGVNDLGNALASGGVGARALGQDLEHTVGTLAQFAQNGIMGERAGTLFRQMLSNLAAPSNKAADLMAKYGFSARDAAGHMKNTTQIAAGLQKSFGHLSDAERDNALKTIAGRYAFQGLLILMKGGAAENARWVKTIQDQGFATQQASGKMNNLAGDLSKLGAAFHNGLISTGETATGTLRGLVQMATNLVTGFDHLSPAARTALLEVGGGVGAIALAGGTALLVVPKIAAFKRSLSELGFVAKTTAAALGDEAAAAEAASLAGSGGKVGGGRLAGVAGKASGLSKVSKVVGYAGTVGAIAGVGLAGLQYVQNKARDAQAAEIKGAIGNASKLAAARKELALLQSRQLPADHSGYRLGGGADVASMYTGSTARIEQLRAVIAAATTAQNKNSVSTHKNAAEQKIVADAVKNHTDRLRPLVALGIPLDASNAQAAIQLDKLAKKGDLLVGSLQRLGGAYQVTTFDATAFGQALQSSLGGAFSLTDATDAVTTAERNLAAQTKKIGHITTGNSDKAIQNRAALEGLTKAVGNQISAYAAQNHTAAQVDRYARRVTDAFYKQELQANFTRKSLKPYVDALHSVPADVRSSLTIQTGPAYKAIKAASDRVASLQAKVDRFHGKNVPIDLETELAAAKLKLAQAVVDSYHGKTVPLAVRRELADANVKVAQAHVDSFKGKTVPLDVLNALANAHIQDTNLRLKRTPTKHDTVLGTPGYDTVMTHLGRVQLGLRQTPFYHDTKLSTPGFTSVMSNLGKVRGSIALLHDKTVTLTVTQRGVALAHVKESQYSKGNYAGYAGGGPLQGPYAGPRADNVLYWGTPREFLVRNGPSQKHRRLLEAINRDDPAVPRYADGGQLRLRQQALGTSGVERYLTSVNSSTSGWLDAQAKAVQQRLQSAQNAAGGGSGPVSTGANVALGRSMAAAYGWTGGQFIDLNKLWTQESGWNNHARNPSSGAYGIPQGLPPGKMGAAAAGGNAHAQIAWGLGYIKGRYGSPAGAWAHEVSHNWYAGGGELQGPHRGPKADNVTYRGTPGEWLVPNGPSQRFRPFLEAITPGYARGGEITSTADKVARVRGYASGGLISGTPDTSAITSLLGGSYSTSADVAAARAALAAALAAVRAAASAQSKAAHQHQARSNILWGQVSASAWKQLMKQGWYENSGDAEKLWAPGHRPNSKTQRLTWTEYSDRARAIAEDKKWAALEKQGWYEAKGDANHLYAPTKMTKMSDATSALTKKRVALTQATRKLSAVEASYAAGSRPLADQFASASTATVRTNASFMSNLDRLASLGFGGLAMSLLSMGDDTAHTIAAQAVHWSSSKLTGLQATLGKSADQQKRLALLPAELAIESALHGDKNPTLAMISSQSGLSTTDLQAALIAMKGSLRGNRNAGALLGGLNSTATYVQGTWGQTTAKPGPTYQINVENKGPDPIRAGELAMAGVQRHAAVSAGRW